MTRPAHIRLTITIAAFAALAACGSKEPEVVGGPAPDATAIEAANKAPVVLPPAIKITRNYRCNNKKLVTISYLADDVTANLRPTDAPTSAPILLKASAPGEPFVAEGYSLSGSGEQATLTEPGTGAQTCKA